MLIKPFFFSVILCTKTCVQAAAWLFIRSTRLDTCPTEVTADSFSSEVERADEQRRKTCFFQQCCRRPKPSLVISKKRIRSAPPSVLSHTTQKTELESHHPTTSTTCLKMALRSTFSGQRRPRSEKNLRHVQPRFTKTPRARASDVPTTPRQQAWLASCLKSG